MVSPKDIIDATTLLPRARRVTVRKLLYFLWKVNIKSGGIIVSLLTSISCGGLALSLFDGKTIAEGQYLAFITATTIGYGDLSPETWPARCASIWIGINGLILTGVVVAFAVKALELAYVDSNQELDELAKKIPEPKGFDPS